MGWIDRILRLLGTNRTQLKWRWKRFQDARHAPASGAVPVRRQRRAGGLLDWLIPAETPIVTMVLLAACVSLYFVVVQASVDVTGEEGGMFGPRPSHVALLRYGASNPYLISEAGQWWRIATAGFLHGGIGHILFNGMSLWVIGKTVENTFGRARMLTLFLTTGILGHLASYGWRAWRGELVGSVGASAAIFGMLGCIVVYARRERTAAAAELRAQFIPWLIFALIMGFAMPRIDHAAHIGGLLSGAAFGLFLADKRTVRRGPTWFWVVAAAALVVLTVVCFARAAMTPIPGELW